LQGAGDDPADIELAQPDTELPRIAFTVRRQRQIGAAGVLPGESPGRFAMPGEVCNWQGLAQ
jgi:hypothetical protein